MLNTGELPEVNYQEKGVKLVGFSQCKGTVTASKSREAKIQTMLCFKLKKKV